MNKGYLYLVFAAASYASMGVLVKVISVDTGPYLQTFLRLIVSGILTTILVLISRKSLFLKHKSDYILMFLMGVVGYGYNIILFTLALYHTTISNTLFLLSGYPIVASLFAYFFLKEKITKNVIIALLLLCVSLFLIFQPSLGTSFIGNIYAILCGFTAALYAICSRIMNKRGNAPETITLWSVGLAIVTSGIMTASFETITFTLPPLTITALLIFGFLNAAAYNLINKGFATVAAGVGTIILLLEPVIGSILGLIIFHEVPTVLFLIGAILLLVSVAIAVKK